MPIGAGRVRICPGPPSWRLTAPHLCVGRVLVIFLSWRINKLLSAFAADHQKEGWMRERRHPQLGRRRRSYVMALLVIGETTEAARP